MRRALGCQHSAVLVFVLRLDISQPQLIFNLICVDLFQRFSSILPCQLISPTLLSLDCAFAPKEELAVICLIVYFFTNAQDILSFSHTFHLFFTTWTAVWAGAGAATAGTWAAGTAAARAATAWFWFSLGLPLCWCPLFGRRFFLFIFWAACSRAAGATVSFLGFPFLVIPTYLLLLIVIWTAARSTTALFWFWLFFLCLNLSLWLCYRLWFSFFRIFGAVTRATTRGWRFSFLLPLLFQGISIDGLS